MKFNTRLAELAAVLTIAAGLSAAHLLDVPTEESLERVTIADLEDARAAATRAATGSAATKSMREYADDIESQTQK